MLDRKMFLHTLYTECHATEQRTSDVQKILDYQYFRICELLTGTQPHKAFIAVCTVSQCVMKRVSVTRVWKIHWCCLRVCVCVCMVWNIWWSPYCKIPEIKRIFVHVNSSNLIYICTLNHFDYHLREVSLKFYSKFDIVHGNIFICNWGIQYTSDRYCVFQLNHNVFSFLVTFTV